MNDSTAPAALALPAPAAAGAVAVPTDKGGHAFRPGFHRVNADGSPFVGKHGQFMPRGGRHKKPVQTEFPAEKKLEPVQQEIPAVTQTAAPDTARVPNFDDVAKVVGNAPAGSQGETATAAPLEVVETISHDASAEAILRSSYAITDSVLAGHGEWQPEDQTEHTGLKGSFVAWQKARGGKPIPPGWAFLATVIAFVSKRLRQPNTAKRLVKWFPDLAEVLGVAAPVPVEKTPAPAAPSAPARPVEPVSTSIA